jgi:hypothetical protein
MLPLLNLLSHTLHLSVIVFSIVGWAFPETRALHLVVCGLTLCSWFILGPLIGKPGFCFLTGLQHWLWRERGEPNDENYMCFLYRRLTKRAPTERDVKRIDLTTQLVLYAGTILSVVLISI